MYNPNEDKRENENNMEPIHGHVENEHEEKVLNENEYSENTSNAYESKDMEQNAAEDAKAEEVKSEQSQQTYHSETLRDYTPEDAQPMCFESETTEKAEKAENTEHVHQEFTEEDTAEHSEHASGPREERRKQEKNKNCYAEHVKKHSKKRNSGWAKLIAGCLIIGLAGGTGIGAGYGVVEQHYQNAGGSTVTSSGTMNVEKTATGTGMSTIDVVRAVKPSVVSITTKIEGVTSYYGAFSVPYEGEGAGSGVIFYSDDDKIAIVTNNHVIEDATEVYATINDTTSVQAKVVGTKSDSDLAVLTISWDDLRAAGIDEVTVATFGDSDKLEVGESVIAIGNAMGLGLSATDGIVSVKNQTISVDNNTLNVIQTSAAINSGNSGGALVNSRGEVVGINTAKYNSSMAEGMGYAIPSNEVISVAQDLLEDGTVTTPYIGIMGTSITSENASLYKLPVGALIVEVTEGGPAAQAGIQAGDIITEFNGKTVMDMDSLSELVKETEIGQTVSVHIIRNGEKGMDLQLTIQDKNA